MFIGIGEEDGIGIECLSGSGLKKPYSQIDSTGSSRI